MTRTRDFGDSPSAKPKHVCRQQFVAYILHFVFCIVLCTLFVYWKPTTVIGWVLCTSIYVQLKAF